MAPGDRIMRQTLQPQADLRGIPPSIPLLLGDTRRVHYLQVCRLSWAVCQAQRMLQVITAIASFRRRQSRYTKAQPQSLDDMPLHTTSATTMPPLDQLCDEWQIST